MGALTVLVGALLAVNPVSVWAPQIAEASARFGIPPGWIERVIAAESGGHIRLGGRPVRSRAGAIGLLQLMPQTWAEMRDSEHLGNDPDDPRDNILAGTAYLCAMYDRFGYPGLFAAYNAGPARYAAALATGQRLPQETLAYLAAVTGLPRHLPAQREAAMQSLFVVRHDRVETSSPANPAPADGLFVARGSGASGP